MVTDPELDDRRLRRGTKTGACLTMLPFTVNGEELGAQEWRNDLFLGYAIESPDLLSRCNGCNTKFSICHYLDCKKAGLITIRHNDHCDEVADLSGKAFTHLHMRGNPLIHQGCVVREGKAQPMGSSTNNPPATIDNLDQKGDILIHDLWQRGTDSIHDMSVVNTDALSYRNKAPEKCLQTVEN